MPHFVLLLLAFSPQPQNCILPLFYCYSRFLFTILQVLWLDHWESIFLFTNTETQKSLIWSMFLTLLQWLFFWFIISDWILSHFSIAPFFLTISLPVQVRSCLANAFTTHSSAASLTFINLLHVGCCSVMTTACSGSPFLAWHLLCCSSPVPLGIWTTILFLVLEGLTVTWASPQFLQRPLQHQLKCLVCLSVLELSESLPGILFSFPSSLKQGIDDLSFSVSLLIHLQSY